MSSTSTTFTSSQPQVPEQTSVVGSLPSMQTRFRAGEIDRLSSALKIIVCERASQLAKNGYTRNWGYWQINRHLYPADACFDAELMDRTLELWARFCALGQNKECKSRRFRLNAVEIWVLQQAIRMASHQERHSASKGKARRRDSKWSSLLHKLESLHRKARRAWLHSEQRSSFESYHSRWEHHQLWVRICYGCLCRRPATVRTQQRRRSYVKRGIEVAKEALREAEIEVPSEVQLRKYVRLAFREIRRDRQQYTIKEVVEGQQPARFFLSYFIRERLRRNGQLKYVTSN